MRRTFLIYLVTLAFVLASILFSLLKGSTSLSLSTLMQTKSPLYYDVLWKIRIPRTLAAFTSGALLTLSGLLMQLLLQNPLADPYVLGISSGAALFTLATMLVTTQEQYLLGGALLGSMLSIALILSLSRQHRFHAHSLLLVGIALACGFSAGISFLLLLSPTHTLSAMLFWLTGDLNGATLPLIPGLILLAGFLICLALAPGLNLLARGAWVAQTLGLSVLHYRVLLYLLSALFTAFSVTLCGSIGFVGLIVPHITRLLLGHDHRLLLPMGCLWGGSFLTMADTLARTLLSPVQLPVGIILAFIGVPTFIVLLQKEVRKSFAPRI